MNQKRKKKIYILQGQKDLKDTCCKNKDPSYNERGTKISRHKHRDSNLRV